MATRKQRGRRAGGHNKGYWYYQGRERNLDADFS